MLIWDAWWGRAKQESLNIEIDETRSLLNSVLIYLVVHIVGGVRPRLLGTGTPFLETLY